MPTYIGSLAVQYGVHRASGNTETLVSLTGLFLQPAQFVSPSDVVPSH